MKMVNELKFKPRLWVHRFLAMVMQSGDAGGLGVVDNSAKGGG